MVKVKLIAPRVNIHVGKVIVVNVTTQYRMPGIHRRAPNRARIDMLIYDLSPEVVASAVKVSITG